MAKREVPSSGVRLDPFYIWVQEEGTEASPMDSQEHALSLLTEYKAREALLELGEGKKSSKKNKLKGPVIDPEQIIDHMKRFQCRQHSPEEGHQQRG